jgi:uncharacterized membrane protein
MKHDPLNFGRARPWQSEATRRQQHQARQAAIAALVFAIACAAAMHVAMNHGSAGGALLFSLGGSLALMFVAFAASEA